MGRAGASGVGQVFSPGTRWDCSDMGKTKVLKAWPGIRTIPHPISIGAFSLTNSSVWALQGVSNQGAMWVISLSSGSQGKAPLEAGISDPSPHTALLRKLSLLSVLEQESC